jgi:hypothetical protein
MGAIPVRPKTLKPITLPGFKAVMKRFAYKCVLDEPPNLQFEKDGTIPMDYEEAAQYWPEVVTHRHPDWECDKHPGELVYDSSDIIDFVQKIIVTSIPAMDRTEVGFEIRAILESMPPSPPPEPQEKRPQEAKRGKNPKVS